MNQSTSQTNLTYIQPTQDEFGLISMFFSPSSLPSVSKIHKPNENGSYFYIDTGANRFCTIEEHILSDVQELNPPVLINVNKQDVAICARKVGTVSLITEKGYKIYDNGSYKSFTS